MYQLVNTLDKYNKLCFNGAAKYLGGRVGYEIISSLKLKKIAGEAGSAEGAKEAETLASSL